MSLAWMGIEGKLQIILHELQSRFDPRSLIVLEFQLIELLNQKNVLIINLILNFEFTIYPSFVSF